MSVNVTAPKFAYGPLTLAFIVGLFLLLIVLILTLNALMIVSIIRKRELLEKPTNVLIIGLAFSDFVTGFVGVPVYIPSVVTGKQLETMDKDDPNLLVIIICISMSIVFHLLLTIDRYISIVYPYRYLNITAKRTVFVTCASAGTIIFLIGLRTFVGGRFALLCLLVLGISQLLMQIKVMSIAVKMSKYRQNDQTSRNELKAIKMTILIFIAYDGCFLPKFFFIVLQQSAYQLSLSILTMLRVLTDIIWISNSIVNPIICAMTNLAIKKACREVFNIILKKHSVHPLRNGDT
ncbi:neuropeptide S receptor-like [Anneissia japonica]|uniref:neuropeptide S receptor-like n=1 Tax=Anneissia japonica TaxID=1529436 RepID=UPI0014255B3B|nr:neuropeptide S receptor-like [Anneissia japonica]